MSSIESGHIIWRLEYRRLPRLALLVAFAAVSGVCATSEGIASSARAGENFDLRIGETATIAGEPLAVSFDRVVEDSRCPTNTTCIWAGTAVVQLGLRLSDSESGTLTLQTTSDAAREGVFRKYRLRLIQLAPSPTDSAPVAADQYLLTLVVRRLE